MHRSSSQRKQLLQRIGVYSLMTISVIGLVTLLIFFTLGYRYNQNEGVVQTGLVQFGSKPSGAQVTIDGQNFDARTPSKASLEAGSHTIAMQRDGYRQWQKSIDVVGGAVLWLNYARLIPTELEPENVADFSTVSSTAVSPDAKWMLVAEDPTKATLQLIDLTKTTIEPTKLTIPANAYSVTEEGQTHRFTLGQWDPNSRYVVVEHFYGDKREWLVVDTRDTAASQNMTRLVGVDAAKLSFGNSDSVLYAQIGGVVRRIDRGNATLSRPLVENVADFSLYGDDTIIFTRHSSNEPGKRDVGYYRIGENKTYEVGSYRDNQGAMARMAIAQYFGDTYMAISRDGKVDILTGSLSEPSSEWQKVGSLNLPAAQHLSIVTAGRFVIAQNGATYGVYDLELKKSTITKLQGTGDVTKELRWLDGYTIWSDRGGNLRLYEFDGANQQEIMKVVPGYNVTLNPDGKYLYGITKLGNTFHLTRVQLIL